MNIEYIKSGDYYIPNLKLPEEKRSIGKWGRMHREYLKEHHPIQYTNLVLSCQLWTYLTDLNEQAQDLRDRITQQLKEAENVTESVKAENPMMWVQHMNSIRNRAEEIILRELVYGEVAV